MKRGYKFTIETGEVHFQGFQYNLEGLSINQEKVPIFYNFRQEEPTIIEARVFVKGSKLKMEAEIPEQYWDLYPCIAASIIESKKGEEIIKEAKEEEAKQRGIEEEMRIERMCVTIVERSKLQCIGLCSIPTQTSIKTIRQQIEIIDKKRERKKERKTIKQKRIETKEKENINVKNSEKLEEHRDKITLTIQNTLDTRDKRWMFLKMEFPNILPYIQIEGTLDDTSHNIFFEFEKRNMVKLLATCLNTKFNTDLRLF